MSTNACSLSKLRHLKEWMPKQLHTYSFGAFNTRCELQLIHDSKSLVNAVVCDCVDWVRWFQAKFSRFEPDSIVSQLNALGTIDCECEHLDALVAISDRAFFCSGGRMDPTSLPLSNYWTRLSANANADASEEMIHRLLETVGWSKVERIAHSVKFPKEGMAVDFGGIGKEYAVDWVASLLSKQGIEHFLINFGGDVFCRGHCFKQRLDGWAVAIENPFSSEKALCRVLIKNAALASSGHHHRQKNGRSHIVNALTGYPIDSEIVSVSVMANDCVTAGLSATRLCMETRVEGAINAMNKEGIRGLVLSESGIYVASKGFELSVL